MATKSTVKIKLGQSLGGHRTRFNPETKANEVVGIFSYNVGDEIDWDAEEAKRLAERGIATIVG